MTDEHICSPPRHPTFIAQFKINYGKSTRLFLSSETPEHMETREYSIIYLQVPAALHFQQIFILNTRISGPVLSGPYPRPVTLQVSYTLPRRTSSFDPLVFAIRPIAPLVSIH